MCKCVIFSLEPCLKASSVKLEVFKKIISRIQSHPTPVHWGLADNSSDIILYFDWIARGMSSIRSSAEVQQHIILCA